MRPRYKVAYKTVSDMEWRCCPGYSGDDCAEGGTPFTTSRPRPQPARPNLSGFNNALSSLGGEGAPLPAPLHHSALPGFEEGLASSPSAGSIVTRLR